MLDSTTCFLCSVQQPVKAVFFFVLIMLVEEEESFYQQIGLKFEEETSEVLRLEHGSVWC